MDSDEIQDILQLEGEVLKGEPQGEVVTVAVSASGNNVYIYSFSTSGNNLYVCSFERKPFAGGGDNTAALSTADDPV